MGLLERHFIGKTKEKGADTCPVYSDDAFP